MRLTWRGLESETHGEDLGAARVGQGRRQRLHVGPHRLGIDRRQDEGHLDDLLQVLARLDLALVATADGVLDGLGVERQHEHPALPRPGRA